MKMKIEEAEAFVSIINSLIEMMPQDECNFDDVCIGYNEDGTIESANGDDLIDVLNWVLYDVIPYVSKENLLKEALSKNEDIEGEEDD